MKITYPSQRQGATGLRDLTQRGLNFIFGPQGFIWLMGRN
jgi:hypothetical protein